MADVLAVEYPRLRCARVASLRLADAVCAGVVSVRALALIVPGRRSRWTVRHGFPSVIDHGSWWSGYAAVSGALYGAPEVVLDLPSGLRVAERFDPLAAVRFCERVRRPRVAVMVKLAEPTPLLVLEALRPARADARLLRSTLSSDEEALTATLLAPAARRGAPDHQP